MKRALPLLLSLALVLGTGGLGLAVAHDAQDQAEAVHVEDRVALQENLAALTRQYLLFAAQELSSSASTGEWSLASGDPSDEARLERLVGTSQLFDHGAALVTAERRILTSYAQEPGLPTRDHPGYGPLTASLLRGEPGFSSVMEVGDVPLVAVAVPVPAGAAAPAGGTDGEPAAVLLGFFRSDATPLQTYVERLRFGDSGRGFVLDAGGTVVAAHDPELLGTSRPGLQEGVDPAEGAVFHELEARGGEGDGGGGERAVSAAPTGVGGWTVATVQDSSEFFGVIRQGGQRFRMALLAVLALAAGGLTFLNHRRLAALRKAAHRVLHDGLTELPNRTYFHQRLDAALDRSHAGDDAVALLFLDIDHFKVINDSLGHGTGDELLVEVADRLRDVAPEDATVARLGGDEFTILLERVDAGDAERFGDEVLRAFAKPVVIDGRRLAITLSIGLAVSPRSDCTGEDLLRDADLAMYRAKERGRACLARFEPELADEAVQRLQLEADLRRALERGEIEAHYQPQVDLVGGTAVAFEALARWRRPDGVVAPAGQFIPVAESTGLVVPLGREILEEACRQARRWEAEHGHPVGVGANISPVQLGSGHGLVADVDRVLRETGLPPEQLTLEVTEQVMLDEEAVRALRELRELGVGLAIDDFGAGYSSLSHLRRLPVTELKLDKTLVRAVGAEAEADVLVRALLSLASELGIVVTAEGIEEEAQLDRLRQLGCARGQGFLLHEPVSPAEIGELLAHPRPLVATPAGTVETAAAAPPRP